jgi:HAD superfamily 5'-nucleotidase-like hydrolase
MDDTEDVRPALSAEDPTSPTTRGPRTLGVDAVVQDPARRLFINRDIRLDRIRMVGFDMDYTLLPYAKRAIEELSYRLTAERLVDAHGYPRAIRDLPYDPEFVVRGLVVDKRRGNILKMDSHGHVGRGYHGRRPLSKDERREVYRHQKIRLGGARFHLIDTLFALPEGVLYANVIDHLELVEGRRDVDYVRLFEVIRAAIDLCHRDGSLKAIVMARPERFVDVDPELPATLHKLRSSGKRLFLLTNSLWDYTDHMMRFLLDGKLAEYPSWTSYFDLVVVGADKPGFFNEDRPFVEVDRRTGLTSSQPVTRLERQHVYQGGSIRRLEELAGVRGEDVLYVGDHIYGDIIRSKKDTLWRTALIISELEDELRVAPTQAAAVEELVALEQRLDTLEDEAHDLRLKLAAIGAALDDDPGRAAGEVTELVQLRKTLRLGLDKRRRELKAAVERRDVLHDAIDRAYNRFWGSIFKEAHDNSRFGRQVERYACLYTSRVSNLLFYSPQQYLRAPRHWMPHEKA